MEIRPDQEEICKGTIRRLVLSYLSEVNGYEAKLLKKILVLVEGNQLEEAVRIIKAVIVINCDNNVFDLLFVQILVIQGKFTKAKDYLRRLSQKEGTDYRHFLLSGDVNRILSDYVRAEADYKRAAILNENDEQSFVNLADLYYQTGRLGHAYNMCQKVLKIAEFREDIQIFLQRLDKQRKRRDVFSATVAALSVSGDYGFVSEIQIASYQGNGTLFSTGNISDVLNESISIAWSFLKTFLSDESLEKMSLRDFHIHFPFLSVFKDGPSAGLAIVVALFSGIQRKKIVLDWAFTGEIDLVGNVLTVGDISTKLEAANRGNIRKVFIPANNHIVWTKIKRSITGNMEVIPVKNIQEVLKEL